MVVEGGFQKKDLEDSRVKFEVEVDMVVEDSRVYEVEVEVEVDDMLKVLGMVQEGMQ